MSVELCFLALILRANNGIFVEDAEFFLLGPILSNNGVPCPTVLRILIHTHGIGSSLALLYGV